MGATKKLTATVLKVIDIGGPALSDSLIAKLRDQELFTYRDTVLKEHIYSLDTVHEKIHETAKWFTEEELTEINLITSTLIKHDAGYFRFVF